MKKRLIRGYPIKYCRKHALFDQGFKEYCFICGTDLYKRRISKLKLKKAGE